MKPSFKALSKAPFKGPITLGSLASLAGAAAVLFALTASKCDSTTDFPSYVAEICNDKIDNDSDGQVDCADSDCANACTVGVTIGVVPAILGQDTLNLSGSVTNSSAVAITVIPSGSVDNSGQATVSGGTWQARLRNLSARTTYTVKAVAADANNRGDTATVSFERRD